MTTLVSNWRDSCSEKEQIAVSDGKLCPNPKCKSTNITCMGANPDGTTMNFAYDCADCGTEWEGT